ncbi:non-ribosomal peptide synthetase [Actinomadura verrucosospora]|uniref:Non-ribosomal peptide synthetase n=1 Tax=Actinomadura verrucosospora TaxID=46165 RepID=A0A7D3ZC28_ACTVE|nr:non-ribosomal peptide synthetase [Actinomadura verrucosospora]QKG18657.1 non-ribosomal peptide synthetase [Actinomadura verrucosospora]
MASEPTSLSAREHAFWLLQQLVPDGRTSNLALSLRSTERLRWWPLQRAVDHLAVRHPALRTRFPTVDGLPVRQVASADEFDLRVEFLPTTSATREEDAREFARRPFDLARDFPLRVVCFVSTDPDEDYICIVLHHIVGDQASYDVLTEELVQLYDGVAERNEIPAGLRDEMPMLDALPDSDLGSIGYWQEQLRGFDTSGLALAGARPSPQRPTFAGRRISGKLSERTLAAVAELRASVRATENMVMLSAFYATLFRHGASTDLVVGVPVDARRGGEHERIGFRVSTLPLRLRIDPAQGFGAFVRQARDRFMAGIEHSAVSVEEVLTGLDRRSADWRVPLFRHMFNHRVESDTDLLIGGRVLDPESIEMDQTRLDVEFTVRPTPAGEVAVQIEYSTEVHDEAQMRALWEHFEMLLQRAALEPDRPLADLDVCTPAERAVLAGLEGAERRWTCGPTVLDEIAAMERADPDAVQVLDGERRVTRGRLGAAARTVAADLRERGVGPGDVVAVALPRGAEMAATLLGVLRCGAAYLPLDAGNPDERLAYQMADSGARAVVTDRPEPGWAGDAPVLRPPGLDGAAPGTDGPAGDPWAPCPPDSAAYVIYTSGSTGAPKGVLVSHANLHNVVCDFAERLPVGEGTTVLWSTTPAFDISALEFFLPLCRGGRLVVASKDDQTDPRALLELVSRHGVDVVQATPTALRLVADELGDELRDRTVLSGGEPLPAGLANRLLDGGCRLFNVYGPTETTIWSTAALVEAPVTGAVPIGRPVANTTVFLLDEHGAEVPPGMPGELCIAGAGVTPGYPRSPGLTAERFPSDERHGRYYRTGDIARLDADGALVVIGRNDRQIKLRGHRIELAEIEAALRDHAAVGAVAVTVEGDLQHDARVLAFVRPADPAERDLAESLWTHAARTLPPYCLPSRIIVVDAFPTTANGKVDYGRLTEALDGPRAAAPDDEDAPADAPAELLDQLVGLWREVLGRGHLGPRDHFFLNGGHSVLAVRLAQRLREEGGPDLPIRVVFDHPTPAGLAVHIAGEMVAR